MGKLRPLHYSRFIQVLCLMDAYIAPPNRDGVFMIYQSGGSGYLRTPRGPQAPFKERFADELVTVGEIESTLQLLGFSAKVFIEMEEGCQIPVEPSPVPTDTSAELTKE